MHLVRSAELLVEQYVRLECLLGNAGRREPGHLQWFQPSDLGDQHCWRGSNDYLAMQDDGNLVIYTSAGKPVWGAGTHSDTLFSSATLRPGYYLHSLNGQYNAYMQTDGNFVDRFSVTSDPL